MVVDSFFEQTAGQSSTQQPPAQRKTTLKWDENGELTSIDMARINVGKSIRAALKLLQRWGEQDGLLPIRSSRTSTALP